MTWFRKAKSADRIAPERCGRCGEGIGVVHLERLGVNGDAPQSVRERHLERARDRVVVAVGGRRAAEVVDRLDPEAIVPVPARHAVARREFVIARRRWAAPEHGVRVDRRQRARERIGDRDEKDRP